MLTEEKQKQPGGGENLAKSGKRKKLKIENTKVMDFSGSQTNL